MLGKINSFLNKYLFIINPVGLIIGIIFSKYFGWLKTITTFLVAVVTLCGTVFIGLADFKSVIKKPKALFLSWFASHVFWASFVFLVGKLLFRGNTDLILGLVLVFAIPCAITSTIWANIYDGNNALSIVLVVFDTVLAPLVCPFTITLFFGQSITMDIISLMKSIAIMVVVPSVIGVTLHAFAGKWIEEHETVFKFSSKMFAIMTVIGNGSKVRAQLAYYQLSDIVPVVLITAAVIAISYIVNHAFMYKVVKLPLEDVVSANFGCGMKNAAVCLTIALDYFPVSTSIPSVSLFFIQDLISGSYGKYLTNLREKQA